HRLEAPHSHPARRGPVYACVGCGSGVLAGEPAAARGVLADASSAAGRDRGLTSVAASSRPSQLPTLGFNKARSPPENAATGTPKKPSGSGRDFGTGAAGAAGAGAAAEGAGAAGCLGHASAQTSEPSFGGERSRAVHLWASAGLFHGRGQSSDAVGKVEYTSPQI